MTNKTLIKNALANKPLERNPTKEELQTIKKELSKLPRGLSWRVYTTGRIAIQITFTYQGVTCREILEGLRNNKSDINFAIARKGEIEAAQARGVFKYADFFPKSKNLEKFGEAKSNATLGDYIEQYIVASKKKGKSPSTIDKYNRHKGYLSSIIDKEIISITPLSIKKHFSQVKVSVNTAQIDFHLVNKALAIAVVDEVINTNPCNDIDIKEIVDCAQKINNTSDQADPFTLKECYQLIDAAYNKNNGLGNMLQFWLNSGLRTQEILGLQWGSINLKERTITVTHTMVAGQLRVIGKDKHAAKNKFASRTFPINDAALQALQKQKPLTYFKKGFVFLDTDGTPFTHSTKFCNGVWKTLIKHAHIRYRRPYNCRHTFATMVISAKNKTNSWELIKWMGHTSVTMLEQHYASFEKEFETIDSKIGVSPPSAPSLQVQNACKS